MIQRAWLGQAGPPWIKARAVRAMVFDTTGLAGPGWALLDQSTSCARSGTDPPPVSSKVVALKVFTKILGNSLSFTKVANWKVRV